MKDKAIFKKWWFWVIAAVVVLGAIGAASSPDSSINVPNDTNSSQVTDSSSNDATLPLLTAGDYKGKEGLVVYKDLKAKGYKVEAGFENQALTDINGKATDVFEPLDPNKPEDRQSVDSFIVGNLTQDGDSVELTIVKSTN